TSRTGRRGAHPLSYHWHGYRRRYACMKIHKVEIRQQALKLTRPYAIAYRLVDSIDNVFVRIESEDGLIGMGACAPEEVVTGESIAMCVGALEAAQSWLENRDVLDALEPGAELDQKFGLAPAARAALDMALHDLASQAAGLPLAKWLGQVHS